MQTPGGYLTRHSGYSPSMSASHYPAHSATKKTIASREKSNPTPTLGSGSRVPGMESGSKISYDVTDRELTPLGDNEEVLLDASVLIGKAAVLSQKSAKNCAYVLLDKDVYVSSARWERQYGGDDLDEDEEEEEEEDDMTRMQAQMSQDY